MTPEKLIEMVERATPAPWCVDETDESLDVRGEHAVAKVWIHLAGPMTMGDDAIAEVQERALADAHLCSLAPALARLCAEQHEALIALAKHGDVTRVQATLDAFAALGELAAIGEEGAA